MTDAELFAIALDADRGDGEITIPNMLVRAWRHDTSVKAEQITDAIQGWERQGLIEASPPLRGGWSGLGAWRFTYAGYVKAAPQPTS